MNFSIPKKLLGTLFAIFFISGCATTDGGNAFTLLDQINNSTLEMMGTYTAPTLAASPRPSGCSDPRCRRLDEIEFNYYQQAKNKQITWLQLVDGFYQQRLQLYPNSNDAGGVRKLHAYQRMLAEQRDRGLITETQWVYLIESKVSEISTSNSALSTRKSDSRSGGVTCFKQSEWTSGVNKNCAYNCMGSQAVQTMRSVDVCPISIIR